MSAIALKSVLLCSLQPLVIVSGYFEGVFDYSEVGIYSYILFILPSSKRTIYIIMEVHIKHCTQKLSNSAS